MSGKENNVCFLNYSNVGIPKLYVEAGRKRHPVTHKLANSELNNDHDKSKPIYTPPADVRDALIQDLEEKDYDDEQLNDEQREVMEDIWLKADEMGK